MIEPQLKLRLVRTVSVLGALCCSLILLANILEHRPLNLYTAFLSGSLALLFAFVFFFSKRPAFAAVSGMVISAASLLALSTQLLLVNPHLSLSGRSSSYFFAAIIVFSTFTVGRRWGGFCVLVASLVCSYVFFNRPLNADPGYGAKSFTELIDPVLTFLFSYLVIVTANKTIEEALEEMSRQARELDDKRKLASLGYFITGIVHEIRNPLAVISGASRITQQSLQVLRDALVRNSETSNAELSQPLQKANQLNEKIARSSAKIEAIIEGLLHLARPIDLNNLKERHRIDLHLILRELQESYTDLLLSQDIRLAIELDAYRKIEVFAEHYHIYSALRIYLSNAIEALSPSPDTRGLAPARQQSLAKFIRVLVDICDGQQVKIRIIDNGSGISVEARPSIFREIYSSKQDGFGTGIGLGFVKAMADILGWQPGFESQPGATEFWLILPGIAEPERESDELPGSPSSSLSQVC